MLPNDEIRRICSHNSDEVATSETFHNLISQRRRFCHGRQEISTRLDCVDRPSWLLVVLPSSRRVLARIHEDTKDYAGHLKVDPSLG